VKINLKNGVNLIDFPFTIIKDLKKPSFTTFISGLNKIQQTFMDINLLQFVFGRNRIKKILSLL
jgi:hypothetical protein